MIMEVQRYALIVHLKNQGIQSLFRFLHPVIKEATPVSLKDIALQAGVSITTVSRILNQDSSLSVADETRQRVEKIANEMNYKPNKKKPRSATIGIVTWFTEEQEKNDPYYLTLRLSAEKELKKQGYKSVPIFGDSTWTNVRRCTGVIAIGRFSTAQQLRLKALNPSLVIIGDNSLENDISCVTSDNEVGVKRVLQDFIDHSRENIGILIAEGRTSDDLEKIYDRRLVDYRHYLRSKHLYRAENVFSIAEVSRKAGYNGIQTAYRKLGKDFPNALFVTSDTLALGALDFFIENEIKVPQQVSVVSFNDSQLAETAKPSLTSVKVDLPLMAKRGVEMLLQIITVDADVAERTIIGTSISFRESSD